MSDLTDWANTTIRTRPWKTSANAMSCGCEDGGHEPDCYSNPDAHGGVLPKPRVWNKHFETPPKGAVYIGRGGFSKFGNPFSHMSVSGTIKVATREEAVVAFRILLEQMPELAAAARRDLRGKDLVCWCSPPKIACHGTVLLEIANED